jgi:hypothetical protein
MEVYMCMYVYILQARAEEADAFHTTIYVTKCMYVYCRRVRRRRTKSARARFRRQSH